MVVKFYLPGLFQNPTDVACFCKPADFIFGPRQIPGIIVKPRNFGGWNLFFLGQFQIFNFLGPGKIGWGIFGGHFGIWARGEIFLGGTPGNIVAPFGGF